jgi:hypothetical protein
MVNLNAPPLELPLSFQPIVILGAGRSGTNALRDMLVRLPGTTTWPCDEINPIWRFGNTSWPTDRIPVSRATQRVRHFIRQAFAAQWSRGRNARYVIEKTCSNTLRVAFVNAVLPEAKFVVIIRDGRSVVPSAVKRWRGELEVPSIKYFLAKARFIPISSVPYVGWRFVSTRMGKIFGGTKLSFWGPRFDITENLDTFPLEQVCALQWRTCVEATEAALSKVAPSRVLRIRYEDMISDPDDVLARVLEFMRMNPSIEQREYATRIVRDFQNQETGEKKPKNIDMRLGVKTLKTLNPCLERLGYI